MEANVEYIKVDTQMSTEKSTYTRFKSTADKTECPTCNSHLDVTEAASARDSAKERWLNLKGSRDLLKSTVDTLTIKNKDFIKYKNYINSKDKLSVSATQAQHNLDVYLEANEEFIGGTVEDIYQISDEIADLRDTMTRLKKDIAKIQESNKSAVVSNAERNARLQQLEDAKSQLDSAEKDYNETNDEVSELEILTKAFGSKGLVAYRIEHSVKAVEKGINEYLSVMTSGRFALGFELDGAKLDVVIYDNGDKVEVNSLSTGQFTKVQLSTLLAIRKVLSAVSSVDVNFLFIDETVSFLDKPSKDILVEVLLKETDLNVFLVSHGYEHPLARAMHVASVDNMSHIEV
jgi:DNA repair exonuclease SbcCD ATPase subunit